jgi:glycosyltransferase involved in cell wall biosynthesis
MARFVLLKRYVPGVHRFLRDLVFIHIPRLGMFLSSIPWRSEAQFHRVVAGGRGILRGARKRRSVVFLHHSYYHFYYLARALRRRGWDAITVSLENPHGPNADYYHGEDLNLYSADYEQFMYNLRVFHAAAKRRFALLHFAGDGQMSFFSNNFESDDPWDILEWRNAGRKIAYTISGCNSGVAQSSVMRWSSQGGGTAVCQKCVWRLDPRVCSDTKNLAWGKAFEEHCDVIFTDALPALDHQASQKAVREPTTTCLDPMFWRPDLPVPRNYRIPRGPAEFLVYHAMGNYDVRTMNGRNIKGTAAVVEAIEKLKTEGIRVRLIFVTGMKNTEVRFLQVQCDVIVDQLNYGRYGATAREGMMLGKPTICYLNKTESTPEQHLACLDEVPLVSATEDTVYETLRGLLLSPGKRDAIGKAGRAYALKWHSGDACAERYERIYDELMEGKVKAYGTHVMPRMPGPSDSLAAVEREQADA